MNTTFPTHSPDDATFDAAYAKLLWSLVRLLTLTVRRSCTRIKERQLRTFLFETDTVSETANILAPQE